MKKGLTTKFFCILIVVIFTKALGQVGINTSAPQAALDVLSKGNTAATKAFKINNSSNTEIVTTTDAGRVGIGAPVPEGQLHVRTTEAGGIISERASTAAIGEPSYLVLRKNGSASTTANGAVISGAALGAVVFTGNTGSGYTADLINGTSGIHSDAAENFTGSAQGSNLMFYTVPTGTITNAERVRINNQGQVGVGTSAPAGQFHVMTTGASGIISERASNSASGSPAYVVLRRNGSATTDTDGAVPTGAAIGALVFTGNTGSGYNANPINGTSGVQSYATENFTTTNQGADLRFYTVPNGTITNAQRMSISNAGRVGIGRDATTNPLEVEGNASKTTAGAWIANSDGRLKKDILQISGQEALDKLLRLKGVYYYWNDNKTGAKRPVERQMGFIAQNIQEVFPEKVTEDAKGYLQTAYGDYDAVVVEAIRALSQKIEKLEKDNAELKSKVQSLSK